MRGEQEEDKTRRACSAFDGVQDHRRENEKYEKRKEKRNKEKTTKKRRDCAKGETACTADDRSRLFSTFRDIFQLLFPF